MNKILIQIRGLLTLMIVKFGMRLLKWRNRPPKFLIHPDPRLKRIAEPIDFEHGTRAQRMQIVRKMNNALGGATYGQRLGLAAPQIGINKRVVIVRGNVMFNPTWHPSKAPTNTVTEGCYSVPKKMYNVQRAQYGWAHWIDIDGQPHKGKLKDLAAIVFQHELDHLDGKCCIDVGVELKSPTPPPPKDSGECRAN